MNPLYYLYGLVMSPIVALSLLVFASWVVVLRAFGTSRRTMTKWIRGWDKLALFLLGIRVEIIGAENDRPDETALIVSNHQSMLDIPLAFAVTGGDMRMVSKSSLKYIPFLGWGMSASEYVWVHRSKKESRTAAAHAISRALKSGLSLWVAPEGTRSKDGGLLEFRPGSFALAIEAGVPVQPLVVEDAYRALPKGALVVRPFRTVRVHVLPRVSTAGLKMDQKAELSAQVHQMMQATLAKARARA